MYEMKPVSPVRKRKFTVKGRSRMDNNNFTIVSPLPNDPSGWTLQIIIEITMTKNCSIIV